MLAHRTHCFVVGAGTEIVFRFIARKFYLHIIQLRTVHNSAYHIVTAFPQMHSALAQIFQSALVNGCRTVFFYKLISDFHFNLHSLPPKRRLFSRRFYTFLYLYIIA